MRAWRLISGMAGGQFAPAAIPLELSFVANTYSQPIVAGSDPININLPTCVQDDMLIVAIMHRDVIAMPPDWTLIESASIEDGITQTTSVFYKKAALADSQKTISYSLASGRTAWIAASIRGGSLGTPSIAQSSKASGETLLAANVDASGSNKKILFVAQSAVYGFSDNSQYYNPPVGYSSLGPNYVANLRMAAGYAMVTSGQLPSAGFDNPARPIKTASVSVLLS